MTRAVVLGAGGFIGGHLVQRLQHDGVWVRAVDIRRHEFRPVVGDEFVQCDLRDPKAVASALDDTIDHVYQLAADMGGAEYVFTGTHDLDIMHNSATINLNVCHVLRDHPSITTVFYSSSACIYPERNQLDPDNPNCSEASAYPAEPDSEYGWEKLFSERLYQTLQRHRPDLRVRIARFHNIFGPQGCWRGGREKCPAAMCRKVAEAITHVDVFGDGLQTRSFLYVDECVEGVCRLVASDVTEPINIGSAEAISINDFARMIMRVANKPGLEIRHVPGPQGVRGRNSDNRLILEKLQWQPTQPLEVGIASTYQWIVSEMARA